MNKGHDMIEERREFIKGFMAAARIFGRIDCDERIEMLDMDFRESPSTERILPLDDYLQIPTYIRKGRKLTAPHGKKAQRQSFSGFWEENSL